MIPAARGKDLTRLVYDRFGLTRRWWERLPLIGDRLLRRRARAFLSDMLRGKMAGT